MRRFSTPLAFTGIKTLRNFGSSSREQSERERRRFRRRRGPLEEALATGFDTNSVSSVEITGCHPVLTRDARTLGEICGVLVRAQPKASHGRVDFACGEGGAAPLAFPQLRPAGR